MNHLAQAVRDSRDAQVVSIALSALRKTWSQPSLDIIWKAWQEKRHPYLLGLLQELKQPASNPPLLRVLSILKLNQTHLITQGPTQLIQPLIEACHDPDPEICARAQTCLPGLKHPAAVDGFCAAWEATREVVLETILIKSAYLARKPLSLRVLTALKLGRMDIPQAIGAEGVPALLAVCTDRDTDIASRARGILTQLKKQETQQALCQQVIDTGDELARQACLQAGYLPQDQVQRVLFLFLTEQWEAYQDLDFDQSMLHAVYLTAGPEMRQRITHQLQGSGRTNLLPIIAGANFRAVPSIAGEEEAEVLVAMLSMQDDWKTLWRLVDELPFRWSLRIVRQLVQKSWLPEEADERTFFQQLVAFLGEAGSSPGRSGVPDSPAAFSFPPAVLRARVNVKGRINDIAFAPDGPYLAIGTGRRKVVLWDYQKAAIKTVYSKPTHSIGQVAYCPDGSLLCAEKSNKAVRCAINGWFGDTPFYLGDHTSSITALEPVGHGLVLSTGRDQAIKLWDLNQRRLISQLLLDDWPRAACISPDGQFALLLQAKPALIKLPELRLVMGGKSQPVTPLCQPGDLTGMPRTAAFDEPGGLMIIGGSGGQITSVVYKATSVAATPAMNTGQAITGHTGQVIGIESLSRRGIVLSASTGGEVIFTAWPDCIEKSRLTFPTSHLSVLKVSPDGFFMAVGSADEHLWLWDLRSLDLSQLMTRPFSSFSVDHLALISMLLEDNGLSESHLSDAGLLAESGETILSTSGLSKESRSALGYIKRILQHRFRYDIQVNDLPKIQAGEYDIILD